MVILKINTMEAVILTWAIMMGLWTIYELTMSYVEIKNKEHKK